MLKPDSWPVALTIAGSDSGGGAGVQADLKTFVALGVHGVCAITCLTAQNPRGIRALQPTRAGLVRDQFEAIFAELPPAAAKTGLLANAAITRAVAAYFRAGGCPPLIVDPVMVATSGKQLLEPAALRVLQRDLLPLAALVTPNMPEAEILTGRRLRSVDDLRAAAREIHARFGCAALVKGGHLRGVRMAVDVLYDGRVETLLSAPFVRGIRTHGTGCTYSAAIVAHLARGCALPEAVQRAKQFITQAIAGSRRVQGHWILNWSAHVQPIATR